MKLKLYLILIFCSFSSHATEFHRCIDASGITHMTNMPLSLLDKNCMQNKTYHEYHLEQDYARLSDEYKKFESVSKENKENKSDGFNLKIPHMDILDSDVALEELMDATEDRNDPVTRALRSTLSDIKTTRMPPSNNPIPPEN